MRLLALLLALTNSSSTSVAEGKDKLAINSSPSLEEAQRCADVMATKNGCNACGIYFKDAIRVGRTTGFSAYAWTPLSWVVFQSHERKKIGQELEVTKSMIAPVFRVTAFPDVSTNATTQYGASGVEHVVVMSTDQQTVAQPIEKDYDAVTMKNLKNLLGWSANYLGWSSNYQMVVASFKLDEVLEIASLDKKSEFFIKIVGTTGEAKKFKVKSKFFKHLQ
jgi:hypothetical protein